MNRLTARDSDRKAYFPACFDGYCDACDCNSENCEFIDMDVCDRLSAYEDTGLTPEQIIQMDKLYLEKCEELAKLRKEIYGKC